MREKIKLGVLTALIVLLAIAVPAWAGTPAPSGDIELADFDIHRTGTPDYDLVWGFYTGFDVRNLEHLPRAGVPRPDGYYWVIVRQEERAAIHDMVQELQQLMGDDFPVAVSVSGPAAVDEAEMAALQAGVARMLDEDIYRTGNPDLRLVTEFDEQFDISSLEYTQGDPPLIIALGVRFDGYFWIVLREENWDAIYDTVAKLQREMGEDFPIAVRVGLWGMLGEVG